MRIALIIMAIMLMALCYEIGYCKGYETRGEENEKFVKGEKDEQKSD